MCGSHINGYSRGPKAWVRTGDKFAVTAVWSGVRGQKSLISKEREREVKKKKKKKKNSPPPQTSSYKSPKQTCSFFFFWVRRAGIYGEQ